MGQVLIAFAGLMGAAGVVLAAAGAHGKPGAGLDSAGYLLLIHACAIAAGVAITGQGLLLRPLANVALAGFVLGATLFAADGASRAWLGTRIFPMAAPAGGVIMIAAWLTVAAAALAASRAG